MSICLSVPRGQVEEASDDDDEEQRLAQDRKGKGIINEKALAINLSELWPSLIEQRVSTSQPTPKEEASVMRKVGEFSGTKELDIDLYPRMVRGYQENRTCRRHYLCHGRPRRPVKNPPRVA